MLASTSNIYDLFYNLLSITCLENCLRLTPNWCYMAVGLYAMTTFHFNLVNLAEYIMVFNNQMMNQN
ncbi:hypothetical protein Anas_09265 [Armadillidium nasatum]|uniref:Uncharacterized protein n=1 Tax=Armadillidium nasatum TaxID=96803 RepID=A0A5N5TPX4_9CRUS|nr:hypothetical protein Anas_09265 [Armadillidium nasatum]